MTAIARATEQFIFAPDRDLTEIDARKAFRTSEAEAGNFTEDDKRLFIRRFDIGFDALALQSDLEALRDEYLNQRRLALAGQDQRLHRGTAVSDHNHRQNAATTDEN